ncbi:nitrilase-related carbon-nitrogen hydrolase [Tepidanaerobacter sp. EBM-38]|uniref:nitrilase-related carbon-nitrogen hydrolase n=1 Tax=Tepidanaerobacter sp. EBM-38 TaxID=1918496 RepID=UPI000A9247CA|nr:nitrilase-related carbon-nitrogen hydrolase [Tepidanaerobacter sp. EBM-38]
MEHIELKISLLQTDTIYRDFKANLSQAEIMISKALNRRKKPNVLVLPAILAAGSNEQEAAAVNQLQKLAAQNSVNIVTSCTFDTAYAVDRQGHIIASCNQANEMQPESCIFDLDGISCGIIPGCDLRFPEVVRQSALKGAKVLFVLGKWPKLREIHWKLLNIVRAIENQFFVVAVNSAGKPRTGACSGMSMVVDPWGKILAESDESPEILTTVIDVGLVERARGQNPVLNDITAN